jgi:predicted DsbA family dithiol-disulfide isomerase
MDRERAAAHLATSDDLQAVQSEIASAQSIGVTGVPTFILGGRYGVVGAQSPDVLAKAFADAAKALAAS